MHKKRFTSLFLAVMLIVSIVSGDSLFKGQAVYAYTSNGDFELGDLTGWKVYGNESSASAVDGQYESGHYIGESKRASTQTEDGEWWGLGYQLDVDSGSEYYFSTAVKTQNTNDAHIKIEWMDEEGNNIGNSFVRGGLYGNTEWKTYSSSVIAPETAKYAELRFFHGLPASGEAVMYVDDVTLIKPEIKYAVLPNANFELGNLDNWISIGTPDCTGVIAGSYVSGNYMGESKVTSEQTDFPWYGLVYQTQVDSGSIYRFSSAFKTENSKEAHIKIEWYDQAGNSLLANYINEAINGTQDWFVYDNLLTAPLEAEYVKIQYLHACPDSTISRILVDDMQFYPEPVINGDFEMGNLYKWNISGDANIVSGGYGTGNYMAVSVRDSSDTRNNWSGFNYEVTVDPVNRYEFSSAIKVENCKEAHVKVSWLDADHQPIKKPETTNQYRVDYLISPLNGDHDWQLVWKYFTPPSEAKYAQISFWHINPQVGSGKLYLDNVYFKEYSAQDMAKHFRESGGKPKVLFTATPKGAFGAAFQPLDPNYAIDLYDRNYVAESAEYYYSMPLEETNVLVYGMTYPDKLPFIDEKLSVFENKNPTRQEVKDYVQNGGGLFLNIGYVGYGDVNGVVDNINNFLGDFGAELVWEKVTDEAHKEIYNWTANYTYYDTQNITSNDLTQGVNKIWYPGGKDTYTETTYALKVNDNAWTIDVKGETTASSSSISSEPILMAHRNYGKGRIVILTVDPRFTVAGGSHQAYGGYCLGKGDGAQLYRNIYDWLGDPSIDQGTVFKKSPQPPELKTPNVPKPPTELTDGELEIKLNRTDDVQMNLNQYKGIVGIKSSISGGQNTVAELCTAAQSKGYNFLVFAEDYDLMSKEKYEQLVQQCEAINIRNNNFTAIPGLCLPPAKTYIEPRYYGEGKRIVFNLKDWPTVEEATSPEWHLLLFNHSWPSVIVSEPNLNYHSPWQLMFYTGLAIETYQGNERIDDAAEIYRKLVSSDYRLIPVAVSYLDSVDDVNAYDGAVTYVPAINVDEIKNNLRTFGGSGTSYCTTGPVVDFKYASAKNASYAGFGEEIFTNQKFAMKIEANSDSKLQEVIVYRDNDIFKKYYPTSDIFSKTIFLTKDANHAFTVEVTDINGKKAVSNSVRTGSPYHNFTMCTDKQNVIHNFFGKEGTEGIIQSFWLSGKDLGQLYVNKNATEIAPVGEDASWAVASVVEGMPKAWLKNIPFGGDDPAVSTTYPRRMRLSTDDAIVVDSTIQDPLFEGYTRYTSFRPKFHGDNILMVEGNYVTKEEITLGDSINNLELLMFRVMGNYANKPFEKYVFSPNHNTKIEGSISAPSEKVEEAFIPVEGDFSLSEGGYIGMWSSKVGNMMLFSMDNNKHDISFGMTSSRRVFEESGSGIYRNYLAYGLQNPNAIIPANTPIGYKLLFVIDNGTWEDESHADAIRSAYRLGESEGIEAQIDHGTVVENKFNLKVNAEQNYAIMSLVKRYMPNDILPVIVNNTNENWDAVEYDFRTKNFRKLYGIDGALYDAVDVSTRDRKLFIGNPIVSSEDILKISLVKGNQGEMEAAVHNPSNNVLTAKVHSSTGLEDIFGLDYTGTWQPGETKRLSLNHYTAYSFECTGPIDVAQNKSATADSYSSNGTIPDYAVDGLNDTKWESIGDGQHWIRIDLGEQQNVSRFIVKHAGAGIEPEIYNTRNYCIQYNMDGTDQWFNAVTVEDNINNMTVHDIQPIKARYIRLLINNSNSADHDDIARIYGFEVYTGN